MERYFAAFAASHAGLTGKLACLTKLVGMPMVDLLVGEGRAALCTYPQVRLLHSSGQLAWSLALESGKSLRLDALTSDGGRIRLAREAAIQLEIEQVWLDSRDPNVPSMLDMDEMTKLLLGESGSIFCGCRAKKLWQVLLLASCI